MLCSPMWELDQQMFPSVKVFFQILTWKSLHVCFRSGWCCILLYVWSLPSCILWQWKPLRWQEEESIGRHYNTKSLSFLSCDGRVGWQWIFVCFLTFTDTIRILYPTLRDEVSLLCHWTIPRTVKRLLPIVAVSFAKTDLWHFKQ